jgi:hypothetical protein
MPDNFNISDPKERHGSVAAPALLPLKGGSTYDARNYPPSARERVVVASVFR